MQQQSHLRGGSGSLTVHAVHPPKDYDMTDECTSDTPAKGPEEAHEAEVAPARILNGVKTETEMILNAERFLERATRWGLIS